ncbi:hypothetical protein [Nonomuraea basaltis]|uniref:hypothetical protein n=1 Tax=Nonomuraea basaltis TaxID=2495887 RepID=UPI00110C4EFD|nr:hypothetical protein [Nonomuraea basaltis]TMR96459.1 hypothetical protein EJK15_23420 [Nonomuraea basaltis]
MHANAKGSEPASDAAFWHAISSTGSQSRTSAELGPGDDRLDRLPHPGFFLRAAATVGLKQRLYLVEVVADGGELLGARPALHHEHPSSTPIAPTGTRGGLADDEEIPSVMKIVTKFS